MIKWIKNFFENERYTTRELDDLKEVWESLDPKLQICVQEPFDFGRKKDFTLKLNEVGMVQLIQHLDRHGFEIKRKEQT